MISLVRDQGIVANSVRWTRSWRRCVPQEKLRCSYQKTECSLDMEQAKTPMPLHGLVVYTEELVHCPEGCKNQQKNETILSLSYLLTFGALASPTVSLFLLSLYSSLYFFLSLQIFPFSPHPSKQPYFDIISNIIPPPFSSLNFLKDS